MSISIIELINYVKKHVAIIMVCIVLCGILGDLYYERAQKYYATTTVKYIFKDAELGITPNGESLDAYEMVSPAVIEKALSKLNLNVGIESIRSSTTITPFIDGTTKEKQEAMLKQGEEYEYFPTKYTVTFINGEKEGADYGVQVLNRLFEAYDEYIQETYTNTGRFPNVFLNLDCDNYDYMEICELYSEQLDNLLDMLDGYASQMPEFRSTKTGLSFNDLKIYFSSIKETEYANLYSIVRSGCLSKNKEVLLKSYQYKIEQLQITNSKKLEESKMSNSIMVDFYRQYQSGIAYNSWQNGENNGGIVYSDKLPQNMTTYDEIMTSYVDSGVAAANASRDIEYYQKLIEDYTNDTLTEEQKLESTKSADELIQKINNRLKEYIEIANETLNDYNVYKGSNYVSYLSSVSVDAKMSRMSTVLFGSVAGAFMGIFGVIVIEVIRKLMEEEKFKDKRKKIELLEKGILPKDISNMPPLERALFEAVSDELKEFYLLYQPIIDNEGRWVGAEAFVRWGSKEFGIIMPNEFIKIAEKYDIMEVLGKWILHEACAKCKRWNKDLDKDFFISVNFTLKQVTSRIFMDEILSALNEVKLNSKNLVLEVTSGIGTESADVIRKKLSAIKTFGVGIAIDDFDKSEIRNYELVDMPIDIVKVEPEYIERSNIITIGKQYDFKVAAQMVETRESYEKLVDLGVGYIQGFYISKPLSEEQFIEEYKKQL